MPEISYTDRRLNELKLRWEQDPNSRIYLQLADEYRKLGRQAEAIAVLTTGLKRRPNDLATMVALGRCRLELGELDEASRTLETVIARDPTHLVANRWLIEAYLQSANAEKAGERLEIYRLLNDRDPEVESLDYRLRQLRTDHQPDPEPAPIAEAIVEPPGPEPEIAAPQLVDDAPQPEPEPVSTPFEMVSPPPKPAPPQVELTPPPPEPTPSPFAMAPPSSPEPTPSPFELKPPPKPAPPRPAPASPFEVASPPPSKPAPSPFDIAPPPAAATSVAARSDGDIFQLGPSMTAPGPARPRDDIFQLGAPTPPAPAPAGLGSSAASGQAAPMRQDPFGFLTPPETAVATRAPGRQDIFSLAGPASSPPPQVAPEPFPPAPKIAPASPEPLPEPAQVAEPRPPAAVSAVPLPFGVDTTVGALPAEPPAAEICEPREAPAEPEMAPPGEIETATATLGELYLKQGYIEEAKKIFRRVLEKDPENPAATAGLKRIKSMGRRVLTAHQLLARHAGEDLWPEGLTAKKMLMLKGYLQHLRGAGQDHVR